MRAGRGAGSLFDPTDITLSVTLNTPITSLKLDVMYTAAQLTKVGCCDRIYYLAAFDGMPADE